MQLGNKAWGWVITQYRHSNDCQHNLQSEKEAGCLPQHGFSTTVVNGAEWLGGNSQQVTGNSGLI